MATKRRTELKALFKNGSVPTAQHFADLIDSTINKRDDHFFGLWQPGAAYFPGDVVIYGKSMYMLQAETSVAPQPVKGQKLQPETPPKPYCSATPPPDDKSNWCMLDFDLQDDDWTIDPTKQFMYATNLAHEVGIGTDCPMAKLHVEEKQFGKLEFIPHESPYFKQKLAELRMTAFDLPDCQPAEYLSIHLDTQHVHLETNTESGFLLEQNKPGATTLQPLLSASSNGEKAAVGVGIKNPLASLHVSSPAQGEFMVNPTGGDVAETLLRCGSENSVHNLADSRANFETNTPLGFRFYVSPDEASKDHSGLPVVIDKNNHVGVGTYKPAAHLEVVRPECGSLQSILDQINPAFSIINLKPSSKGSYFTLGADNAFAVLKTDAPCGFVFKRGDALGSSAQPERNINQGHGQVYIDQEGKVGVGVAPDGYEMDVFGRARTYESYLAHDISNIQNTSMLAENEGLDIVCRLHPIRFEWRESLGNVVSREALQFGLQDFECADVVPEIVRTTGKNECALAYQNLVPVLIKAIQEQQKMIDDMRREIDKLK
jgi:hypothetical protein